ncbi:hypothetical protein TWF106_001821 [Orbilia oligospora]|uniref:Uncharacterized protein n=2 Tax=Orbilia oligospora TaxID=2813651 RepID=A0A7C8QAR2_ORBOL|nr:hypothetical protein TWF106_001821 [Orbilia oligospora]KAF3213909.1 hypothetical protein TWF191_009910 [Orbilia oligospora]
MDDRVCSTNACRQLTRITNLISTFNHPQERIFFSPLSLNTFNMSFALRASRSILPRASAALQSQTRTFAVSASRRSDIVQDLYLRELKSYKPTPPKANDHEGQVRVWKAPATASTPDLGEASLTSDISAYQAQVVETESGVPDAAAEGAVPVKNADDWFDEEAAFAEEKPAHH